MGSNEISQTEFGGECVCTVLTGKKRLDEEYEVVDMPFFWRVGFMRS